MEGFTQLSSGMCSIRTLLRGKHPPLLCQAVQFSAAFNHKKGRADFGKKKEVQWSPLLSYPSPSLFLHVRHRERKAAAVAPALQRRRFESSQKKQWRALSLLCSPYTTPLVFKSSLTQRWLSSDVWWSRAVTYEGKRWKDSREGERQRLHENSRFLNCILSNPNWLQRELCAWKRREEAGLWHTSFETDWENLCFVSMHTLSAPR